MKTNYRFLLGYIWIELYFGLKRILNAHLLMIPKNILLLFKKNELKTYKNNKQNYQTYKLCG